MRRAWCVLVENDGESVGALAAGASLRAASTRGTLVALTARAVRRRARLDLALAGWAVTPVSTRQKRSRWEHAALIVLSLREFEAVAIIETYTIAFEHVDELLKCGAAVCGCHDTSLDKPFPAPFVVSPRRAMPHHIQRLKLLGRCGYTDPLIDAPKNSSCARLPNRYAGYPLWLLLNGDRSDPLRIVRAFKTPPESWVATRRVRLAHLALGKARPWHWWATVVPLGSRWRKFRDEALAVQSEPHEVTLLETRASENFALARSCVMPWLLAVYVLFKLARKRTAPRRKRSSVTVDRVMDVVTGHVGLMIAATVGFFAAQGSDAYHTFFRPSRQLVFKRAPFAGAVVFYSTTFALLSIFLGLRHDVNYRAKSTTSEATNNQPLSPLIPGIASFIFMTSPVLFPTPTNILEAIVPLLTSLLLLGASATMTFVRLGDVVRHWGARR